MQAVTRDKIYLYRQLSNAPSKC